MGCFPKKHSRMFCVIHDLSWPPGQSINDFINQGDFYIRYLSLDEVMSSIKHLGQHTLIAKLDLAPAFHHTQVHQQNYELQGFKFHWYNPTTKVYVKEYSSDSILQFGEKITIVIQWLCCSSRIYYALQSCWIC